jgi:hypothetical protein
MYIHIYIYTHTHIHTYTYTHTHTHLVAVVRIVAGIFRMSGHKVLRKMVVEHWNEGKLFTDLMYRRHTPWPYWGIIDAHDKTSNVSYIVSLKSGVMLSLLTRQEMSLIVKHLAEVKVYRYSASGVLPSRCYMSLWMKNAVTICPIIKCYIATSILISI